MCATSWQHPPSSRCYPRPDSHFRLATATQRRPTIHGWRVTLFFSLLYRVVVLIFFPARPLDRTTSQRPRATPERQAGIATGEGSRLKVTPSVFPMVGRGVRSCDRDAAAIATKDKDSNGTGNRRSCSGPHHQPKKYLGALLFGPSLSLRTPTLKRGIVVFLFSSPPQPHDRPTAHDKDTNPKSTKHLRSTAFLSSRPPIVYANGEAERKEEQAGGR